MKTIKGKIIFKGHFIKYCLWNILWTSLAILGSFLIFPAVLIGIYTAYWNIKYFVANLEIEIYDDRMPISERVRTEKCE